MVRHGAVGPRRAWRGTVGKGRQRYAWSVRLARLGATGSAERGKAGMVRGAQHGIVVAR